MRELTSNILFSQHWDVDTNEELVADIFCELCYRVEFISLLDIRQVDFLDLVEPGGVHYHVRVFNLALVTLVYFHLNLRHDQVGAIHVLGDVLIRSRYGYHAYFLFVSFVVDNSDLLCRWPDNHAISVNNLCYGTFSRHIVIFFYLRFEPSLSILKKTTLHSSNKTFKIVWSELIINHGNALQLFWVAIYLYSLVAKISW